LIAEDDPIFRHILQNWLQRWHYQVTAVSNGLDAWKALQEKTAPKMAVLDWMMPGMDGIELCRKIRQTHGPYRYLLLLTAKDNKQDVVAGLDAGADDYLIKPFDVNELRARVRAGKRILDLQDALLRAHDALQFEAAHDPLTSLWNRGAIMDTLKRELLRQQRSKEPLGIMMADLDHFKKINDSLGHLAGDAVLQESARRLADAVRGYDAVGRYGGEELLILMPGCDTANLPILGERLRQALADRPIQVAEREIPVTLSIGAVCVSAGPSPHSYEDFLRVADAALYSAKANGRNRVEIAPEAKAAAQGGD
jgi:diguanylate cyclase (GGDEF)-like protein